MGGAESETASCPTQVRACVRVVPFFLSETFISAKRERLRRTEVAFRDLRADFCCMLQGSPGRRP